MEKSSIYDIQHEELQHQQGASTSPIIGDEEAAKVLKANINAQAVSLSIAHLIELSCNSGMSTV